MAGNRTLSVALRSIPGDARASVERNFVGIAEEFHRAIQSGSEITGSPGQPVDTGNLRASWILAFLSALRALVSTNVSYAPAVEDGIGTHGPVRYGKSGIGGSHSASLAVLGLPLIVAAVEARPRG